MGRFKIILPIVLFVIIVSIAFISLFPKDVQSSQIFKAEYNSSKSYIDGTRVEAYDVYVDMELYIASAGANATLNYILWAPSFDEEHHTLVKFEPSNGFVIKEITSDDGYYKLVSNKEFSESDGKVYYGTYYAKRTSSWDGSKSANFAIWDSGKATTNNFSLTKNVYQNNSTITKVRVGEEFDYLIQVKGIDNAIATDEVVVTDSIPNELEIVTTSFLSGVSVDGQNITWNLGSIKEGDTTNELSFKVKAKESVLGNVNNTAVLKVADKTISDDVTVNVVDSNVSVTKTVSKASVSVGEEFYYTITLKNTGSISSKDIIVEDTISDAFEFVRSDLAYTKENNKYIFNAGSVKENGTYFFKIYVKAKFSTDKPTSLSNTVYATEENKSSVSSSVSVNIKYPNLTVTKKVSSNELKRGGTLNYVITVTNGGDGDAFNVLVEDEINSSLSFVNTTLGSYADSKVTASLGVLSAGSSKSITVTVRALSTTPLGIITNTSYVSSDNNNKLSASASVTIVDSLIKITKVADKSQCH